MLIGKIGPKYGGEGNCEEGVLGEGEGALYGEDLYPRVFGRSRCIIQADIKFRKVLADRT